MNRQTIISMLIGVVVLIPMLFFMQKEKSDKLNREKIIEQQVLYLEDHPGYLQTPDGLKWAPSHPEAVYRYQQWLKLQGTAPIDSSQTQIAPLANANGTAPVGSGPSAEAAVATNAQRQAFDEQVAAQKEATFELTAKAYHATLSATGAAVDALTFNDIKESSFKLQAGQDKKTLDDYQPLRVYGDPQDKKVRSFSITTRGEAAIDQKPWLHTALPNGGHRFERVLPEGDMVVRKDYIPGQKESDFDFTLEISIENRSAQAKPFGYTLVGPAGLVEPPSARQSGVEAIVAVRDAQNGMRIEREPAATTVSAEKENKKKLDITASAASGLRIAYFGLSTKYFSCAVVPLDKSHPIDSVRSRGLAAYIGHAITPAEEKAVGAHEDTIAKESLVEGVLSEFLVPAGTTLSQKYLVFVGPRSKDLFESSPTYREAGLEDLVDYTSRLPLAESLARLLTIVLAAFHALTRSWGLSIILLTLVVRGALHPLMVKQLRSSTKMQGLAPEMAKLKEKYAGKDGQMSPEGQKRFQTEQWELYKKNGVNPLGCAGPMFLQLPIFYGLFNALGAAYELRHASFLWIRDLSEPDVVARLPFTLPMHGTNALCILPILMLIVYVYQMRSMPKPADPQAAEQQKIMNWMMPFMGYMFYMMPSGLLLYYITSSTIGTLEQRWIKRQIAAENAEAASGVPVPAARA